MTPTTLHKTTHRKDRSPVLSPGAMGIYGSQFARLARYAWAWRVVQLPLFVGTRKGAAK